MSTSIASKTDFVLGPEARALISGIPDPMLIAHVDGTVLLANQAARELFGTEINSRLLLNEISDDPAKAHSLLQRWLRSTDPTPSSLPLFAHGPRAATFRVIGARLASADNDAELVWIRITPSSVANNRFIALNEKFHEIACEVRRRERAERKLQEQNGLLHKQTQLLASIAHGADLKSILETLVRTVQEHTKSGAAVSILLLDDDGVHLRHAAAPDLPEEYCRLIDGLAIGPGVGSCGTCAYTKEPVFVGDVSEHPFWALFRDAVALTGMRACWSSPILSQDNKVLGTFALYYPHANPDIVQDLHIVELCTNTAAVAIQRAKLEQQRTAAESALRRTETLAAAGRLAATVAHEINNPLEAITNLIYLARTDPGTPASIRSMLDIADQEIARVSHIAHRTVGFYRDNSAPHLVNISEVVDDVLQLYSRKFTNKNLQLTRSIDDSVMGWASDGEIRQVVSNLVANAIDACDMGGQIQVRVHARHSVKGVLGAKVSVADDGCGIAAESRAHVFDPFFTTKQDVGTGLGLWISRRIIEKHHGTMRFKTSTGSVHHGTVFSFFVPATPPSNENRQDVPRVGKEVA